MATLAPCPGCSRHLWSTETHCPFCGVGVRFTPGRTLRGRIETLRREIQIAFGASLVGLTTASCQPMASHAETAPGPAPPAKQPDAGAAPLAETPAAPAPDAGVADARREDPSTGGRGLVAIYSDSAIAIADVVEFSPNSLKIDDQGERTVAAVREILEKLECDIAIQGHAGPDDTGANWISRRRAEVVRDRLLSLGAPKERLSVEKFGTSRPLTSDGARDRRVSFRIHEPGKPKESCEEARSRSYERAPEQGIPPIPSK